MPSLKTLGLAAPGMSSSRACPFSFFFFFCWEGGGGGGGGAFRMPRHRGKRPESFIIVKEQKCSLGASGQFHHRPPEEEKGKLGKRERETEN